MQIPRFFLTESALDFEVGKSVQLVEPPILNQIRNVLRMRNGDQLILLDGKGWLYRCTITSIEQRGITCLVQSTEKAAGEPPIKIQLALALIKGERFDWALQKVTELGAFSIVPIITERTVVKIDSDGDAKGTKTKLARWQAILREAAEQSERGTIPHIVPPKKLNDFIDGSTAGGTDSTVYICAERLQVASLRDIFLGYACERKNFDATKDGTINLLIGPEGGFTEDEIRYAQDRGAVPVSLGPRILRAETAAVYAVAQVIWCLEK